MSESTSIKIEFQNSKDAEIAYEILVKENSFYGEKLLCVKNSITDKGIGDSFDDYVMFGRGVESIGNIGITFSGQRDYCSFSTGNEYSERFMSNGKGLTIIDEHECINCGKMVSSKSGMHYSDGYGADEWYCKTCAKECLIEMVNDKIEDEDLSEDDYLLDGKTIENLSIEELVIILDKIEPDTYYVELEGKKIIDND